MRTLSHDEKIQLVSINFSPKWIKESMRLLFEVCLKMSQCCVIHKGAHKACLNLLNEVRENTPRFVSHYLDQLPPVGFGHMDASTLLT